MKNINKFKSLLKHFKRKFSKTFGDSNIRFFILNGIFFTIMATLTKSYIPKFLYRIGGNDSDISLYNSFTGLATMISAIPAIVFANRSKNKKKTMTRFLLFSRFMIFPLIITPLLDVKIAPLVFIILISIMLIPDAIGSTVFQSFVGDAFLPERRSSALSYKSYYSSFIQIVLLIFLSLIFTLPVYTDSQIILLYQVFFVIGGIFGILEILSLLGIKEENKINMVKFNYGEIFSSVFKNGRFLSFLFLSMFFHFSWYFGMPLFQIYQIKNLGANELWLSIFSIVSSIGMLFSYNYWNKTISIKGFSFTMILSSFILAISPLYFIISKTSFMLSIFSIPMGISTAGVTIAIFMGLLNNSPEDKRIAYVGIHSVFIGAMLFIAPLISERVLNHFGMDITLLINSTLRFVACLFFYIRFKILKSKGIL